MNNLATTGTMTLDTSREVGLLRRSVY